MTVFYGFLEANHPTNGSRMTVSHYDSPAFGFIYQSDLGFDVENNAYWYKHRDGFLVLVEHPDGQVNISESINDGAQIQSEQPALSEETHTIVDERHNVEDDIINATEATLIDTGIDTGNDTIYHSLVEPPKLSQSIKRGGLLFLGGAIAMKFFSKSPEPPHRLATQGDFVPF